MFTSKFLAGVFLGFSLLATMGCAGSGCRITGLNVIPTTATADHTASAPGNSQAFNVAFTEGGGDCRSVGTLAVPSINWTVSDPSVHLSSSQGLRVTATCTASVATPITITATAADGEKITGRASLTCN